MDWVMSHCIVETRRGEGRGTLAFLSSRPPARCQCLPLVKPSGSQKHQEPFWCSPGGPDPRAQRGREGRRASGDLAAGANGEESARCLRLLHASP